MPHIGNFPLPAFPSPLSIPTTAFVPSLHTYDWTINGMYVRNGTTLTSQTFWAPVYLPHKATALKLTLYGQRTTVGSELTLYFRRSPRAGADDIIAQVTADWSDGYGSISVDITTYGVIDNENYMYCVSVNIDPDASVLDCQLTGAVIEWK